MHNDELNTLRVELNELKDLCQKFNNYLDTTDKSKSTTPPNDISPEQACIIMTQYFIDGDTELGHVKADGLMCDILTQFGYSSMVNVFKNANKWYA